METSVVFTILGGSGDLALNKIIPALYYSSKENNLPQDFSIIAYARSDYSHKQYRELIFAKIKEQNNKISFEKHIIEKFLSKTYYVQGQYNDIQHSTLKATIQSLPQKENFTSIFYFSVPPACFNDIIHSLSIGNLIKKGNLKQLVVLEKPFGYDTKTANKLNELIHEYTEEKQVFRIDHYLGKEGIQNILFFRFGNIFFAPLWNKDYIKSIHINWSEDKVIGSRGGYFENSGIIRDIIQNHLTQILVFLTMEEPSNLCEKEIFKEKLKLLSAIPAIKPQNAIIGQYTEGVVNGNYAKAYRDEKGVDSKSKRDTFASIKLNINNERWQGVDFFLNAGKAMNENINEIVVEFNDNKVPKLFSQYLDTNKSNSLTIRIQPDPEIRLAIRNKFPGVENLIKDVEMKFNYKEFSTPIPDAYRRLISGVINIDHTLFVAYEELTKSWEIFTPLLHQIDKQELDISFYPVGSTKNNIINK